MNDFDNLIEFAMGGYDYAKTTKEGKKDMPRSITTS
jgi:hypothetical protein